MSKVKEGLGIKELKGSRIMVRRFEYPKQTDSGLILPMSFTKAKEDVNTTIELPKFQNRGEVIAIGSEVKDGEYELGDIVHFQPNYYQVAFLNKTDISKVFNADMYVDNAEVILDAVNGVEWIEEVVKTPS